MFQHDTRTLRRPAALAARRAARSRKVISMIVLGLILLLVGYLTNVGILWTLGIILVVVGVILYALGSMGRSVGGRRHYW